MREIKFRAWDAKYNKIVLWDDISRTNIIGALMNNNNRNISNGILMQYTGLKDKNGVEIYEGDILKSPSECNIGKVCFDIGMFTLHSTHLVHFVPLHEFCEGWEVIGNIYEHPHLLGGE